MEKLNIKRTLELVRYDLTVNRKRHISRVVIILVVMLCLMLFIMMQVSVGNIDSTDFEFKKKLFSKSISTTVFWAYMGYMLGMITAVFEDVLGDKQRRQNYFMLPVTNAERFVSRLGIILLYLLLLPVLTVVARILSLAFLPLFHGSHEVIGCPMLKEMFSEMFLPDLPMFENTGLLATILFLWGIYLLGGIVFQKHTFHKVTLFVVGYVMLGMFVMRSEWFENLFKWLVKTVSFSPGDIKIALWWLHCLIWFVCCLWLAYRRLARTQLTRLGLLERFK